MDVVVFGLGAIGTVYAVSLKAAGHRVFGITKEKYLKQTAGKNFRITGIFGEKEALLDGIFSSCHSLINEKIDLVVLAVKSFDTENSVKEIKTLLNDDTIILLAQNGYGNYETSKHIVGAEHVVLGRIIFGSRLIDIGVAEVTVIADNVIIGQPDLAIDDKKLCSLAEIFSKVGIPTRFSRDVYPILWDKIIYNSALNPLGAILECNYGALAACVDTKKIMNSIISEIFDVAKKAKIKLLWRNIDDYTQHFYNTLIPPTKNHYPSMYYDIKAGKKTEIDALNGAIVKLGFENGVSCPSNELITGLIKAKESMFI